MSVKKRKKKAQYWRSKSNKDWLYRIKAGNGKILKEDGKFPTEASILKEIKLVLGSDFRNVELIEISDPKSEK